MADKKKQENYIIHIRSKNLHIPCTKEQFDNYYRDINAYRRTQTNHGRCICPKSKRLYCDMDCWTCPYHTSGDCLYLDDSFENEKGNRTSWLDYLQETLSELQVPSIEERHLKKTDIEQALARLIEIMPEALEIGRLREQGLSDEEISKKIKIPRNTFLSRLKKAKELLKKIFPDLL